MCFCGVYILHPTAQCTGTPTHRHLSKHCPEVPAHRHSELGKQPQKVPAHSTQAHIVPSHCVPAHQHITPSSHPKNYKKDTSAPYHNHLRHPMQSTFCYKMFLHLPIKTPYPRKINYMFKLLLSLVHKKREKIIFILFVLLGIMSTLIFISLVLILIPILISGEGGIALWPLLISAFIALVVILMTIALYLFSNHPKTSKDNHRFLSHNPGHSLD